jgi:hypothetical protein
LPVSYTENEAEVNYNTVVQQIASLWPRNKKKLLRNFMN